MTVAPRRDRVGMGETDAVNVNQVDRLGMVGRKQNPAHGRSDVEVDVEARSRKAGHVTQ